MVCALRLAAEADYSSTVGGRGAERSLVDLASGGSQPAPPPAEAKANEAKANPAEAPAAAPKLAANAA